MGKSRGRRSERRLAQMSEPLPVKEYQPPPTWICDVFEHPNEVAPNQQIFVRQYIYKGKVVDFAIVQQTLIEGEWRDVARIDCCHGTVHRHQYGSDGKQVGEPRVIRQIPTDDGWNAVDGTYDEADAVMFNEWRDNLRRWRDGR